jgi:hypothetical protein
MLCKIGENIEVVKDLGSESLLRKFVVLAKYFNPGDQMDTRSEYGSKVVDAEKIFQELLYNFNPH